MALVVGGCGADASDETKPTVPEGTLGDVILEISDEGGFVPVEFNLTRVPRFTVFADGTIVVPGDQQFAFPGPSVRPLLRFELDTATLTDLLTFVADLGLEDIDTVDLNNAPNVADASTTVVRYFDESGEHRISIYALGIDSAGDARSAIVASMIATLESAKTQAATSRYEADRFEVYAAGSEGLDPQQLRNAGPWPLDLSPDEFSLQVAGFSCATIDGDAVERLNDALSDADAMTTWTHGGAEFRILARPLLPHQDGC